jgi:hypothetical protein
LKIVATAADSSVPTERDNWFGFQIEEVFGEEEKSLINFTSAIC